MKKNENIIKSYFGVMLESKLIEQNSNILVVLLPGLGYTLDMPLMLYSQELALEMGFDVLPIEYGFQVTRKEFNTEDEMIAVVNESYELLKGSLDHKYERIIFVGKSIGTVIQRKLQNKLEDGSYKGIVSNVYLTPLDKTVELGLKNNSLVILGSLDTLISKENKEKVKKIDSIEYIEIKNTGHSLSIKDDVIKSIDIIKEVVVKEKEFFKL